jgi:hypothetical protein
MSMRMSHVWARTTELRAERPRERNEFSYRNRGTEYNVAFNLFMTCVSQLAELVNWENSIGHPAATFWHRNLTELSVERTMTIQNTAVVIISLFYSLQSLLSP